jgi:hypothetical protein
MQLKREQFRGDKARLQYILGFHSTEEGQVTGSIHSAVRGALMPI